MEDDLIIFVNGRQSHVFVNGRQPQFFRKMEDDLKVIYMPQNLLSG